VTTDRPHVAVIHRWRDSYALYERYLDHDRYAVTYITTDVGLAGVPGRAAGTALVTATDDEDQTRCALARLAERFGEPAGIVALKEDDLLVAAVLRAEWGCPGPRPEDLVRFRDKHVMAQAIADAGIPAPAFAPAPDVGAIQAFAEEHGWPVVVKPYLGSSSERVSKLDGPDDVDRLVLDPDRPMLVQACDFGEIYHVDGVFSGERLGPWRASRYINTCLGFRGGEFLGSIEEDDATTNATIGPFAGRVLRALTASPVVFHLEIFVEHTPGEAPRCRFLEIGARVGGAEIPFLWREVHDYDLMAAGFQVALGETPKMPESTVDNVEPVGGWLLVPAPAARPCRITEVTPMLGRNPGPYAEALLRPGDVLPLADAYYEHVGGRFRFRGQDTDTVHKAILCTAEDFRVRGEPVRG
jgi:biotin carboxylase